MNEWPVLLFALVIMLAVAGLMTSILYTVLQNYYKNNKKNNGNEQ